MSEEEQGGQVAPPEDEPVEPSGDPVGEPGEEGEPGEPDDGDEDEDEEAT